MQGTSHIAVGLAAGVIVNHFHPFVHPALTIGAGIVVIANVLGSLGPDLDADESRIRHLTNTARSDGCLGRLVSVIMPKHRGWIHSPVLAVALALLAWWSGQGWALSAAIGWASHILADNLMGVLHIKNQSLGELALVITAAILAWRVW